MKLAILASYLPALVASAAISERAVNYDGYRVLRVKSNEEVVRLINENNLDTWNGRPENAKFTDVVVEPGNSLFDLFDHEVMHENLGASIAEEANFAPMAANAAPPTQDYFNSYHSYADHLTFLRDLQSGSTSRSEVFSVGSSLQGRNITGIHFWGSAGRNARPAVVIHGTVHAREWITTMVTEYLAWNLLTNYNSNADIRSLVDRYDFYIIPIVNPDGFAYSQTNDRLWRKNRQSVSGNSCLGTDVNRNWNYQWSQARGASTNPCAQDFKGSSAASAPETQRLAAHINGLQSSQGVAMYIDYHSYSQLFMTPYGYTCDRLPANNAQYQSLVQGAAAAIRGPYGTVFQTGPICSTIYQVSGGGVDYVADVTRARYSFTTELRDTGRYGFVLPANQILPSGIEAFAGFRYLILNI